MISIERVIENCTGEDETLAMEKEFIFTIKLRQQ
jgi:hypothetical protein